VGLGKLSDIFPQKIKGMDCSEFNISFPVESEVKSGCGSGLG
jgi:hypothetical protein